MSFFSPKKNTPRPFLLAVEITCPLVVFVWNLKSAKQTPKWILIHRVREGTRFFAFRKVLVSLASRKLKINNRSRNQPIDFEFENVSVDEKLWTAPHKSNQANIIRNLFFRFVLMLLEIRLLFSLAINKKVFFSFPLNLGGDVLSIPVTDSRYRWRSLFMWHISRNCEYIDKIW